MCSAIIVSGTGSGKPVNLEFLQQVRGIVPGKPIVIGSGLRLENAAELLALANGAIVGTAIKTEGKIHNAIDRKRAEALVKTCRALS